MGLWSAVVRGIFGAGSGFRVGRDTIGEVQFLLFGGFLVVRTKVPLRTRYTTRIYHVY